MNRVCSGRICSGRIYSVQNNPFDPVRVGSGQFRIGSTSGQDMSGLDRVWVGLNLDRFIFGSDKFGLGSKRV